VARELLESGSEFFVAHARIEYLNARKISRDLHSVRMTARPAWMSLLELHHRGPTPSSCRRMTKPGGTSLCPQKSMLIFETQRDPGAGFCHPPAPPPYRSPDQVEKKISKKSGEFSNRRERHCAMEGSGNLGLVCGGVHRSRDGRLASAAMAFSQRQLFRDNVPGQERRPSRANSSSMAAFTILGLYPPASQ
jgi:hypothetical protein